MQQITEKIKYIHIKYKKKEYFNHINKTNNISNNTVQLFSTNGQQIKIFSKILKDINIILTL